MATALVWSPTPLSIPGRSTRGLPDIPVGHGHYSAGAVTDASERMVWWLCFYCKGHKRAVKGVDQNLIRGDSKWASVDGNWQC